MAPKRSSEASSSGSAERRSKMHHDHPQERFRSDLARQWFEHPRAIVVEKTVSAEINHQLHINTAFETCGGFLFCSMGMFFIPTYARSSTPTSGPGQVA